MPEPRRLTDVLNPLIENGLRERSMGEEIWYETGIFLLPPPQGPGTALALYMRGAILGTTVQAVTVLQNPFTWDENSIGQVLGALLDTLFQARAQQLEAADTPPPEMARLNNHNPLTGPQ